MASEKVDGIAGDRVKLGDIGNSVGVAVGRNAHAEVHYHYEYVEQPKLGAPYLVPNLPPHYIPRKTELVGLWHLLLNSNQQEVAIALYGMGGIGKTTLAIAFCHDKAVLERFPDGVLWAALGPQAELLNVQLSWGFALGSDLSNLPSVEARTLQLRSLLHNKRCLLVIDDVWDANHLALMQVGGTQCITLVTTRERKIAQKVGAAFELEVFKVCEAVTFLESWAEGYDAGTSDEVSELAKRLGYLPLALKLAGAQAQDGETWISLLTIFRDAQRTDITILDMDDPTLRDESLKLTFDLSLQRLSEPLQRQFIMLGVFAAGREAPFSVEAAAEVWQLSPEEAEKSLKRLVRSALLDREGEVYNLHLMTGNYAWNQLDQSTRQIAEARHRGHYLKVIQHSTNDWQAAETVMPQVRTAWNRLAKEDVEELYTWIAAAKEFFHRRGYWVDSIDWLNTTRIAAQAFGYQRYEAWCENELGWIYQSFGQLDKALKHYQCCLAIQRNMGNRRIEAQVLNRIGYLYIQQGKLHMSLELFEHSFIIYEEIDDQEGQADTLHLIGVAYQRQGQLDKALRQYQSSLAIQEQVGNWRLGAITLQNIGNLYLQRGEFDDALQQLQTALEIQRKLGDKATEGATLISIGRSYEQQGELYEALNHYEAALSIHRSFGNQTLIAQAVNGIGRIHYLQDELHEALVSFQTALNIFREVGDPIGQAEALWNVGRLCKQMERLPEAEEYLVKALTLYEEVGLPETIKVLEDLDWIRNELHSKRS